MRQAEIRGGWFQQIGLGVAALDWLIALGWPQAYRFVVLYQRFAPWEATVVIGLLIASVAGFVLSLAGAFRRTDSEDASWTGIAGMVMNVPPFLVFGALCKGLDPTGF